MSLAIVILVKQASLMIPATSLSHRGDENNLDNDSRNSDSGKSVAVQKYHRRKTIML